MSKRKSHPVFVKGSLFLGFEISSGVEVKIPIFHSLFTGQTRLSGKTTTMKALAVQAMNHGFKVLVLDTKTNVVDYEGFGKDIPVCLRESTDPLPLIYLVEAIIGRRLTQWYPTLTRVSEGAKTFNDIIENAKVLQGKSRAGFVKDACVALIDLLKRLKAQTEKHETSAELKLPHPINRMAINDFQREGQQLIAKTVFEEALKHKKLIIMLDEAYKFAPQKYRSACGQSMQDFVTQGGATECFLWMSTQFLATTSKDAMKTMAVKLLGRQDHDTECEHTIDLIPYAKGRINADDIMTLKLGHFIVVASEEVKTVYVVPQYADTNQAMEVALGTREPNDISYVLPVEKVDLTDLPIEIVEDKKPFEVDDEILQIPIDSEALKLVKLGNATFLEQRVGNLEEIAKRLRDELVASNKRVGRLAKGFIRFSHEMQKLVGPDKRIKLQELTTMVVTETDVQHVTVNTKTNQGKIMMLAKEGFFKRWRYLRDVVREIEDHHWTVKYNSMKTELARLAEAGLLAMKKKGRENVYSLAANVKFTEDRNSDARD